MIENLPIKVDDVGRIVIPKKVRKELNININDLLLLSVNDGRIELKKHLNHDVKLFIRKLNKLSKEYGIDIILVDEKKIVYSRNKEELLLNNVIEKVDFIDSDHCVLTKNYILKVPYYYCSINLNNYTKYKLFVLYKSDEEKMIAKLVCELLDN